MASFAVWLEEYGVPEHLSDYVDLDRLLSLSSRDARTPPAEYKHNNNNNRSRSQGSQGSQGSHLPPGTPAREEYRRREEGSFGRVPPAGKTAVKAAAKRVADRVRGKCAEAGRAAAELGRRSAALHAEASRAYASARESGDPGALRRAVSSMAGRAGSITHSARSLRDRVVGIDLFSRQNVSLLCAAARHGGWEQDLRPDATELVMGALSIDGVVVALSDVYARLREIVEGTAGAGAPGGKWDPPASFERKTTKYWVRLDRVTALKLYLVRELPVLLFGRKGTPAAGDSLSTPQIARQADSGDISSVYFDNDAFECYATRQLRVEGATLIRLRWYGDYDPIDGVFVERKTHHESWVSESSVKERFKLGPESDVDLFLRDGLAVTAERLLSSGDAKPSTVDAAVELAAQVREEIAARQLKPKVRTVYRRTAFQLSSSNAVRVSLDTNLHMIRDYAAPNDGEWCRDLEQDPPGPEDVVRFPYAVLEVKLQDEPPAWVDEMLEECAAVPVFKFSKFLHGISSIYPDGVNIVPHWFESVADRAFAPPWERAILGIVGEDGSLADEDDYSLSDGGAIQNGADTARWQSSGRDGVNSHSESEQLRSRRPPLVPAAAGASGGGGGGGGGGAPSGASSSGAAPTGASGLLGDDERRRALEKRKALARPIKIEPKTFFAVERTLLQWLNTLILLSLASLSTLVLATDRNSTFALVAGVALAATSIIFGMYALYTYFRRLNALTHGTAIRFDDRTGPPALILILCVAMVVSIILSVNDGAGTL